MNNANKIIESIKTALANEIITGVAPDLMALANPANMTQAEREQVADWMKAESQRQAGHAKALRKELRPMKVVR